MKVKEKMKRSGRPLETGKQKEWEDKTGYSYKDIRIHDYSALPQQLATKACILNEDIYLAEGADYLLEHELGHYPDQKQGLHENMVVNGVPVHLDAAKEYIAEHSQYCEKPQYKKSTAYQGYKIGMEFQTIGGNKNIAKRNGEPIGCGIKIDTVDGIDITVDNNHDLEFITKAVDIDEQGNHMKVEADKAATVFESLLSLPAVGNRIAYPTDHPLYTIYRDGEKKAHPQATVGVKFEKLYKLLDAFSKLTLTSKKKAEDIGPFFGSTIKRAEPSYERLSETHQRAGLALGVEKANNAIGEQLSAEEKGFVALLAGFMEIQKKTTGKEIMLLTGMTERTLEADSMGKLAKNFMPVMPRTSPLDLFKRFSFERQIVIGNYMEETYGLQRVLVWQHGGYAPHAMRITLKDWFMGAGIYRNDAFLTQDSARWKTDVLNMNYHSVSEILKVPAKSSTAADHTPDNIIACINRLLTENKANDKLKLILNSLKAQMTGAKRAEKLAEYQVKLMRLCYASDKVSKLLVDDTALKTDVDKLLEALNGFLRSDSGADNYTEARADDVGLYELRALETDVKPEEWGRVGKEVSMLLYTVQQEPRMLPLLRTMSITAVSTPCHTETVPEPVELPENPMLSAQASGSHRQQTSLRTARDSSLLLPQIPSSTISSTITPSEQTSTTPIETTRGAQQQTYSMHLPAIQTRVQRPEQSPSATLTIPAGSTHSTLPLLPRSAVIHSEQVTPVQSDTTVIQKPPDSALPLLLGAASRVRQLSPENSRFTRRYPFASPMQISAVPVQNQTHEVEVARGRDMKIARLEYHIKCVVSACNPIIDETIKKSLQVYLKRLTEEKIRLSKLYHSGYNVDTERAIFDNIRWCFQNLLSVIQSARIMEKIKETVLKDLEKIDILGNL